MIKSFLLYRVTNQAHIDTLNNSLLLGELLENKPDYLPTGSQWNGAGFAPLNADINEELVWSAPGGVSLINFAIHERQLTGATVREYVLARGKKIEEREGRKVYKKEYAQIKDEVLAELLPKAFIKHKRIVTFVMGDLLVVGASTAKNAEWFLNSLREAIDGLSVLPYSTKLAAPEVLKKIMAKGKLGALKCGDAAKLVNDVKDAVAFKGVELSDDEPQSYLHNGFGVKELAVWLDVEMYCRVSDTYIFKGVKFAEDLTRTAYADTDGDPAALIDADVILISDTIRKLVANFDVNVGEERRPVTVPEKQESGLRMTHINDIPLDDLMTPAEKLANLQEQFSGAGDELDEDEDF